MVIDTNLLDNLSAQVEGESSFAAGNGLKE